MIYRDMRRDVGMVMKGWDLGLGLDLGLYSKHHWVVLKSEDVCARRKRALCIIYPLLLHRIESNRTCAYSSSCLHYLDYPFDTSLLQTHDSLSFSLHLTSSSLTCPGLQQWQHTLRV